MLFLLNKGLDYTDIMILQAVNAASIFALEVPTGVVADKIGRKFSLLLSSIMMIIGLIIYMLSSSFFIFIFGEIAFALGLCLRSGADSAILYETLKRLGREKDYAETQGRAQSYSFTMQFIGSLMIGYLYSLNVNLPYLLSAILLSVSLIPVLLIVEPDLEKNLKGSYVQHIKDSAMYVWNNKIVKSIICYSAFIFIIWRTGFWFFQPYMMAVGIEVKYFGIIFAVFNLLAAISARKASFIIDRTGNSALLLLGFLFCGSLILMGVNRVLFGAMFFALQEIARGLRRPILLKYMNENIPSNKRATIISIKSLTENVAIILMYPIIGLAMDKVDIINLHLYVGILFCLSLTVCYKYVRSNLRNKVTTIVE